jgi:acetyl esterase/lipase
MISIETLPYATRNGVDLLVDVYRPAGNAKAAVVFLHGGGWRRGSRQAVAPSAKALAGHGFVVLAAQYRLLGDAPWPAQIQDVNSAIRWARRNAGKLGVDAGRIVVEGLSAGGHLALLAAGAAHVRAFSDDADADQDGSVAAAIAFYPPVEFQLGTPVEGALPANRLLEDRTDARQAELASPIHHVKANFPPTCLFHGTDDHIVSPAASLRLFDRLRATGAAVDLHLQSGQTHAFAMLPSVIPQVQGIAAAFLDKHLVDPQFYISENLELNQFAGGKRPS